MDDDGPGIPPEQIALVLQRGVRGDERVQGHGIGLSIVQDIVRGYRGDSAMVQACPPELGGAPFRECSCRRGFVSLAQAAASEAATRP